MSNIKVRIIEPYISKYVHQVNTHTEGAKICYDEIKQNNLNIDFFKIKDIDSGKIITIRLKKNQIINNTPENHYTNNDVYRLSREIEYKIDKLNQKIDSYINHKPKYESINKDTYIEQNNKDKYIEQNNKDKYIEQNNNDITNKDRASDKNNDIFNKTNEQKIKDDMCILM